MKLLLTLVTSVLLFATVNTPAEITILQCAGIRITGDLADSRRIRFTVDQPFDAVEVRMDGRVAGSYTFDAELRRSTGFVTTPDYVATGIGADLPGDSGTQPYSVVKIGFGEVPVTGSETFTMKFTNITGPGSLFFEPYGIGNEPCPNVEEAETNNVATPLVRGDPAGFKVLSGASPEITSTFDPDSPDPDAGIIVAEGESIHFSGQASDAEDEFIPDTSFVWSFGGTLFATGKSVDAVLPAGTHLVLLSVVDSGGLIGESSVKVTVSPDSDDDGVLDALDNCTLAHNPEQHDTDGDGYGNMCDGDLNNDGSTNTLDLNLYKLAHRANIGNINYNADADFNGDGQINTLDLNIYKGLHRNPPGPSCCPL